MEFLFLALIMVFRNQNLSMRCTHCYLSYPIAASLYRAKNIHMNTCYAMLCYAKSLQSCLTLCDPIDGSPPSSAIPGILQERILEWVAISFSNAWKRKVKVKSLSHVRLLVTPWTAAHQAPPLMGFSRQEYWSGVPLSSPIRIHKHIQISLFSYYLCGYVYTYTHIYLPTYLSADRAFLVS